MLEPRERQAALAALDIVEWLPRAAPAVAVEAPQSTAAASPSAADALGWDELQAAVAACTQCALAAGRTQTVFGVGNRNAEWMIIGEAPGQEEDRQGEPFVGRAGQLLNSMLEALGLARQRVFIANILKCRPPGNRDPEPAEAAACAGWLARQIELVSPRIILCVGRVAAQNLLGTQTPIGKLRGQPYRYGPREIPVVVTWHPAYLLRSPAEKRRAWQDLLLARQVFGQGGG